MRLFFLIFAGLLLTLPSWGQERIRNVRVRSIDSAQLEIQYDLLRVHPGDSVFFAVYGRVSGQLTVSPDFVRGDLGTRLTVGKDRRIIWDARANGYTLNEDVRAQVLLKTNPGASPPKNPADTARVAAAVPVAPVSETGTTRPSTATSSVSPQATGKAVQSAPTPVATVPIDTVRRPRTRYAGPAWALLSAVAPGIGNIFVQTPKPRVGVRPALTLACYGLIAYGLLERTKSQDDYALYLEQKNAAAAMPYYLTANEHHHRYYLATRGAAVVVAVDVLLTFFKGLRNSQLQRKSRQLQGFSVRPGMQASQPTAVLRYSF